MEPLTITIACQGATTVPLDELHDLQGNFKELTDTNYQKLKQSILKYGFSFPVFMWIDPQGAKWIIDSHQRRRTLLRMRDKEGYTIPDLPADIIFAESKSQAKEKLLVLNSRYGKADIEGYEEFIHEEGAEIDEAEISDLLVIPEIGFGGQFTEDTNSETQEGGQPRQEKKEQEVECPSCAHKFTI